MLKSVTYVSFRSAAGPQGDADVQAILATSHPRNKALGITGALFSASQTFAQLIEGPCESVDALMESIGRDVRHKEVKIVSVKHNDERKFSEWAMAYSGDAYYIDRHIQRLLISSSSGTHAEHAAQLESLMEEFSKRAT